VLKSAYRGSPFSLLVSNTTRLKKFIITRLNTDQIMLLDLKDNSVKTFKVNSILEESTYTEINPKDRTDFQIVSTESRLLAYKAYEQNSGLYISDDHLYIFKHLNVKSDKYSANLLLEIYKINQDFSINYLRTEEISELSVNIYRDGKYRFPQYFLMDHDNNNNLYFLNWNGDKKTITKLTIN
jgi:hypothetical protein